MNKQEFLANLQSGLSSLPQAEIEERLTFYSEMIDDRMEEGLSEEEAVAAVGSAEEIISQTIPSPQKAKPQRKFKAWEIVLLVLGSPIWLSLTIAAFAVVFSLYVSLWAVIICLWTAFGSLIGCAFGGVAAGIVFVCNGNLLQGIAMIGAGIICAGLSVFMFYGCNAAAKGIVVLTKKFTVWIKQRFIKKEEA